MRASEEQRRELTGEDSDLPLEKKDLPALMVSGLLVVGLPCLLLILLIVGVTLLIFGR
ncbi:MAG: hypothetical protein IKH77_08900 [Clostridia bacterium]|nr:hypothetical protein [Clostridia bacterium]